MNFIRRFSTRTDLTFNFRLCNIQKKELNYLLEYIEKKKEINQYHNGWISLNIKHQNTKSLIKEFEFTLNDEKDIITFLKNNINNKDDNQDDNQLNLK
jgi:hypothetical protein